MEVHILTTYSITTDEPRYYIVKDRAIISPAIDTYEEALRMIAVQGWKLID
jgi:hypothetical protein